MKFGLGMFMFLVGLFIVISFFSNDFLFAENIGDEKLSYGENKVERKKKSESVTDYFQRYVGGCFQGS